MRHLPLTGNHCDTQDVIKQARYLHVSRQLLMSSERQPSGCGERERISNETLREIERDLD